MRPGKIRKLQPFAECLLPDFDSVAGGGKDPKD